MATMAGLAAWRVRDKMRLIRRGVVAAIVAMALLMNAPVWFSIARLSEIAGGTGWYRSYLIDQAVKHFDEWWLVGSTYTAHWAPAGEVVPSDPNNMDIINHYVAEGLGGGLVKLGLFIAMIVLCFKTIGRQAKQPGPMEVPSRIFVWSLGVCLFGHCVSFFSVSYFDQIIVMWYWLLATISMLLEASTREAVAPNPLTDPSRVQNPDLAGADSGPDDRLDAVV
jgi:predicted transcriptional regulator